MHKKHLTLIFILFGLLVTSCTQNKNIETDSQYVKMDFKNLTISEVAEKVSKIIGKEIIFEHKIKEKTNFVSPKEGVKKDELIPLLNAILDTKGMTLVSKGTHYIVVDSYANGCNNKETNITKIYNIKEAMYRHLLEGKQNDLSYYFLASKKGDEDKKVIERLQDIRPKALPRSMSKVYNAKEMRELTGQADNFELMTRGTLVHHKENGGKGIIYGIYCINKISDTKVVVTWGDYANMLGASESKSTLELIDGKWIVTKTEEVWVS